MDLKGRVAIVTGGGTGIGRAVCLRLASAGAKAVVVNYSRSDKDARATAAELIVLGPDAMAHKADVSNDKEVTAMIEAVKDRYGRIDASSITQAPRDSSPTKISTRSPMRCGTKFSR